MDADIAHEVATHMDATGVCRYAPVCVAAAVAARSEAIWKILALRDHEIAEELLSRWPQFIAGRYRLLYRRLKESRRYCEVMPASSIIAARDVPPSTESYLLTIQLRHNNNHAASRTVTLEELTCVRQGTSWRGHICHFTPAHVLWNGQERTPNCIKNLWEQISTEIEIHCYFNVMIWVTRASDLCVVPLTSHIFASSNVSELDMCRDYTDPELVDAGKDFKSSVDSRSLDLFATFLSKQPVPRGRTRNSPSRWLFISGGLHFLPPEFCDEEDGVPEFTDPFKPPYCNKGMINLSFRSLDRQEPPRNIIDDEEQEALIDASRELLPSETHEIIRAAFVAVDSANKLAVMDVLF